MKCDATRLVDVMASLSRDSRLEDVKFDRIDSSGKTARLVKKGEEFRERGSKIVSE